MQDESPNWYNTLFYLFATYEKDSKSDEIGIYMTSVKINVVKQIKRLRNVISEASILLVLLTKLVVRFRFLIRGTIFRSPPGQPHT